MPDINPTLDLRELVYYDGLPYYIVGHKIVFTAIGNKVVYQIAQDLPNSYGSGRGTYPNELSIFDRTELQNQSEYDQTILANLESHANQYEYTLTGLPIITLHGPQNEKYVFDGEFTYPWDGVSYPPYDPATGIPLNTIWDDAGATVTDTSDEGHAGHEGSTIALGQIIWDGTTYLIDNPDFNLDVEITHTDFDNNTVVVPNINLSILGHYIISYQVTDFQGISSYIALREISVNDVPVLPPSGC
jgi:hypothetical protein